MSTFENSFTQFVEIIARLRDPHGGCPWDLEQTHLSLRPYLIEEAYEVLEAIDKGDDHEFKEELGDLLLQVVLHSQIARERKAFEIKDVIDAVAEKMIRRHPHVFGDLSLQTSNEVLKNWELIKSQERSSKEKKSSALDGVPNALPGLIRAQRIGEKASRVGFDWDSQEGVISKVHEELREFEEVLLASSNSPKKPLTTAPRERPTEIQAKLEDEFGDILFSLAQLGRWLGLSAEDSLRRAIEKFVDRFHKVEKMSLRPLSELSIKELDVLWEKAKIIQK